MQGVDLTVIFNLLLGGGLVATLTAAVRGVTALRSGARAREREAVDDLGRWRDDLDRRARTAERDRDFWRNTAARYAWQIRQAGREPDPADPVAPSER